MPEFATKVPKPVKVNCTGCAGECCKSSRLYLTPEDDVALYDAVPQLHHSPFGQFPAWVLRRKPDGSCINLQEGGGCAIYDHRPAMCRAYSCVNHVAMMKTLPPAEIARRKALFPGVWSEGEKRTRR